MLDCKCKIVSKQLTNGSVKTHCIHIIYRGVAKVWLGVAEATPSLASQAKPSYYLKHFCVLFKAE